MTVSRATPQPEPDRAPAPDLGRAPDWAPVRAPGLRGGARRFQVGLLAASTLAAALAAVAFTGGARPPGTAEVALAAPAPSRSPAPADLARLASLSGCTLRLATSNADFRQGVCTAPAGRVVLVTFTSEAGRRQWTTEAESYGQYLVGPRWAVGGDPALLVRLQFRLGGVVEGSTAHQGHPA
ncbi:hypothetical protein [Peterkaempfera bronchialis]|uniref:hypothetical protein n=1 Tax=Peterkaempfera bronchialis TaxID=2126346 RepID=UPI003C2BC0DA